MILSNAKDIDKAWERKLEKWYKYMHHRLYTTYSIQKRRRIGENRKNLSSVYRDLTNELIYKNTGSRGRHTEGDCSDSNGQDGPLTTNQASKSASRGEENREPS